MQSFIKKAKYSYGIKKISPHYHDAYQILYVVKGSAEITINNKNHSLTEGSLIFISRLESHSINSMSADYSRYEIRISPEIFGSANKDLQLYSILLNRPEGFRRTIDMEPSKIARIFEEISHEYNIISPYNDKMLSLLLDKLFITIYRKYPDMFSTAHIPHFETIYKIQQHFEKDVSQTFSLDSLAQEYHLSKYYLSHIFKNVTGYSIMDYLKNLRLAKAKNLLAKSSMSIEKIVDACGFSDKSNFSKLFKNNTTLSPREFRKIYSEKSMQKHKNQDM